MSDIAQFTAHRAHFSQAIPGLQVAWDSTSLGAFKHCPREYYYSQIECWRPKKEATPLTFGIAYHAGLEEYDIAKTQGADHVEALRKAVRRALEAGKRYEVFTCTGCGAERGKEIPPAAGSVCGHCGSEELSATPVWEPWVSDDTKRNRETLVRSIVWYLEHFANDPAKTIILQNGKPAVELSFRLQTELKTSLGETMVLCGHLDRVVDFAGGIQVMDRKTTTVSLSPDYFDRYSPDNQMSLYILAAQMVFEQPARGAIIDAAQVAVGFTRFHRGFVNRTRGQLDEWLEDLSLWFKLAQTYAENQYWPMNDKSCFLCNFKSICSKDRSVRAAFLRTDYYKSEWNPLTPRGH